MARPLIAGAFPIGYSSVLQAEALALKQALIWAQRPNLKRIEVEGDSKMLQSIVGDIQELLHQFHEVGIDHIYHKANTVAYELSKKGHTVDASCIWFGNFPTHV
ncbi:hypothetical protein PRUPE_1G189700 [Prunus persica]|uniref:RNase H type-1 domain-containing protein n=1 Tax=Prunus persica TaxID=3760 RepID=A0A251QZK2_PRUPE|nr:hypothetical protein PRUPE_1G189700 [Prunus persica]